MAQKTAPKTQPTQEMMERTFIRATEYAAAMEISMETALTHFQPDTAAALAAYVARRAPELLAQRSPHRLPMGDYHPGDYA